MTDHIGEATQKVIDLDALEKLADEFRRRVVDDVKNGPSISAVARRWCISRTTVCGWIRASGVSA